MFELKIVNQILRRRNSCLNAQRRMLDLPKPANSRLLNITFGRLMGVSTEKLSKSIGVRIARPNKKHRIKLQNSPSYYSCIVFVKISGKRR
jgi:hypothetical protein